MKAQEWHDRRRAGIGGSDAASVLGISPWKSTYALWAEKTGLTEPTEESLAMWLGGRMEPILKELYETHSKMRVTRESRIREHSMWPFLYCHVDAKVRGETTGVEFKTASSDRGWDEPEYGGIPAHYYAQVQHMMLVTGWDLFDVAVLFGNRRFEVYPIPRDAAFIEDLLARERIFWSMVQGGIAPPVDGSESTGDALAARYPVDNGDLRPATPEETALIAEYRAHLTQVEVFTRHAEALKNALKERIGDAEGIFGGDAKVTWKASKDTAKVDWERLAKERMPAAALMVAVPEYTTVKPGVRRFVVSPLKEE